MRFRTVMRANLHAFPWVTMSVVELGPRFIATAKAMIPCRQLLAPTANKMPTFKPRKFVQIGVMGIPKLLLEPMAAVVKAALACRKVLVEPLI